MGAARVSKGGRVFASMAGQFSWRADNQVSKDNTVMPPNRWPVTISGISIMVTVQAPNAPCRQTATNKAVASHGDWPSWRRLSQASAAMTMISSPSSLAI